MDRQEFISVVLPVYNEAPNLRCIHEALTRQMQGLGVPYELIFVNDGSRDESMACLRELHRNDPAVKVLSFSRNFGHQYAVTAGIEHARGTAVITMDADMQHPPELLPQMIALWRDGAQVVHTVRRDSKDTGWFKRWTSAAFYRLINLVSDVPVVANSADFRLMDRAVVDCLVTMRERTRFLRGMVCWVGFVQRSIPYTAHPRFAGQSKYSLRKMLTLAMHGITSFSSVPLRLSAYVGFLASVSGLPYAIWAIYARCFTEVAVPGWASLLVAVLFLGGVQLMSIGVIGEYVGRIYDEVKNRPLYVTAEALGFDVQEQASSRVPVSTSTLVGPHFLRPPYGSEVSYR